MKNRFSNSIGVMLLAWLALAANNSAHALTIESQGIDKLVGWSEFILVGDVIAVTDGFDSNRVPYTEVVVRVNESIRGGEMEEFTFRQFGLISPMPVGGGITSLSVTPEGWPTYQEGESVILFMYKQARITGLRTTVGLQQGKFVVKEGQAVNAVNNLGLFRGVPIRRDQLTSAEVMAVEVDRGPVDSEAFISFLRKAVSNRWFGAKAQ